MTARAEGEKVLEKMLDTYGTPFWGEPDNYYLKGRVAVSRFFGMPLSTTKDSYLGLES